MCDIYNMFFIIYYYYIVNFPILLFLDPKDAITFLEKTKEKVGWLTQTSDIAYSLGSHLIWINSLFQMIVMFILNLNQNVILRLNFWYRTVQKHL